MSMSLKKCFQVQVSRERRPKMFLIFTLNFMVSYNYHGKSSESQKLYLGPKHYICLISD